MEADRQFIEAAVATATGRAALRAAVGAEAAAVIIENPRGGNAAGTARIAAALRQNLRRDYPALF